MNGKDNRNEEVLGRTGEKRPIVETTVRRKKNWIGHIMREDGLTKEVMEGKNNLLEKVYGTET